MDGCKYGFAIDHCLFIGKPFELKASAVAKCLQDVIDISMGNAWICINSSLEDGNVQFAVRFIESVVGEI